MKNYQTYLKDGETLKENQEIELTIRDEDTMEWEEVKALVSSRPEGLEGADNLWLYAHSGHNFLLYNKPWKIKVLERKEEEIPEVKIVKKTASLGKMRGSMVESLLRQSEQPKQQ